MCQRLNTTGRWRSICCFCLALLQFTSMICAMPKKLSSLCQVPDNINLPVELLKVGDGLLNSKYILCEENQHLMRKENEKFNGVSLKGKIVYNLESSFETQLNEEKRVQFKVPPKIAKCKTEPRKCDTQELVMFIGEHSKHVLYAFIVTATSSDSFELKLHSSYSSLPSFFYNLNLKFAVKRADAPELEHVTITRERNGNDNPALLTFHKIEGLDAYGYNSGDGTLEKQMFFATEEPSSDKQNRKYIGHVKGASTRIDSELLYCFADGDKVVPGFFDADRNKHNNNLIFSKSAKPAPAFPDPLFVQVFYRNVKTISGVIAGTMDKSHPKRHTYRHTFTVEKGVHHDPSRHPMKFYIDRNYLFTVSNVFGDFKYNPFGIVEIEHIEGYTYGVKSRILPNIAVHKFGSDGELISVKPDEPLLAVGESPYVLCKFANAKADKVGFYSSQKLLRLDIPGMDPINIRFYKCEISNSSNMQANPEIADESKLKTSETRDVYFIQTMKKALMFPTLGRKQFVLSVYSGNSLEWRVFVEISKKNNNATDAADAFIMTSRTVPNSVLSDGIARFPLLYTLTLSKNIPDTNDITVVVAQHKVETRVFFIVKNDDGKVFTEADLFY